MPHYHGRNRHQQYGDHLYEEKDFDGAIVQYAHTIGYIPSSSVIT